MTSPIRQEVLRVLAELSDECAEVCLGQLVVNSSYLARGLAVESAWGMEDDELLQAARRHLEAWRARHEIVA